MSWSNHCCRCRRCFKIWEASSWSWILQREFWQKLEWERYHYSCASIHWLLMETRLDFKILLLTYKALRDQAPSWRHWLCYFPCGFQHPLKVNLVAESGAIRGFCCGIGSLSRWGGPTVPLLLSTSHCCSYANHHVLTYRLRLLEDRNTIYW